MLKLLRSHFQSGHEFRSLRITDYEFLQTSLFIPNVPEPENALLNYENTFKLTVLTHSNAYEKNYVALYMVCRTYALRVICKDLVTFKNAYQN